jgi:hypothetical protein
MFYAFLGSFAGFAKIGATFFLAILYLLLSASGHSGQKHGHMCPLYKNLGAHGFLGFMGFPRIVQKLAQFFGSPVFKFKNSDWWTSQFLHWAMKSSLY